MLSFNSFYLFIEYFSLDKLGVGVVTKSLAEGCLSFKRIEGKHQVSIHILCLFLGCILHLLLYFFHVSYLSALSICLAAFSASFCSVTGAIISSKASATELSSSVWRRKSQPIIFNQRPLIRHPGNLYPEPTGPKHHNPMNLAR